MIEPLDSDTRKWPGSCWAISTRLVSYGDGTITCKRYSYLTFYSCFKMRVIYPKLTRTLEVAVNYRNGNSRSREPEYKIFGKIALWRIQVSDREKELFTKLPDQCLILPQSLLEYINQQLPENPLCIFKPNGLLPFQRRRLSPCKSCVLASTRLASTFLMR